MQEVSVASFAEFHQALREGFEYGCLFRGVPKATYGLVPRVGRQLPVYESMGATREDLLESERQAFDIFCEEGASLFPSYVGSAIDRLVVAQHHGLPTRLLDWTFNPLVALFFATNAQSTEAGAVYALKRSRTSLTWLTEEESRAPFDCTGVHGYLPKHVSPRVTAQRGLFTIHGSPTDAFDSDHLTKIRVAASAKNDLFKTLKWYGITDHALFPDLDGLSRFIAGTAFLNLGPP